MSHGRTGARYAMLVLFAAEVDRPRADAEYEPHPAAMLGGGARRDLKKPSSPAPSSSRAIRELKRPQGPCGIKAER